MATNFNSNTAAPTSKMKNLQACFLGLPAELRVRIYGFVFSGVWVKEEKQKLTQDQTTAAKEQRESCTQSEMEVKDHSGEGSANVETNPGEKSPRMHCCGRRNPIRTARGSSAIPTTCICCLDRIHPAILLTSRLIYKEALPVFYGSIEVRFDLPLAWTPFGTAYFVRWSLARLPEARLPMISQMVYAQRPTIDEDREENHPTSATFCQFWQAVEIRLPGIEHVRIHLDLGESFYVREHLFRDLARATRLPKLKMMEIELSCTILRRLLSASGEHKDSDEDKKTIADLQEDFVTSIKSEAERMGKRIGVKIS